VRVVSLLPSATEIVAALGAMDQIVGVTHECDFPVEVASRARVTACDVDADATPGAIDEQVRTLTGEGRSLYTLDETLIRALRPDLILTQALCDVCAVMETDVRALAGRLTPVPAVVSLSATTLDGVFADIERAGAAIGREAEAANLVGALRRRMRAVHDTLSAARAPRPRVAVIEWTDPVFAAGHWVADMVRRAGGIDVLATGGEHSRVVPIERIDEANAEIVIFAPCGYGLEHAANEARVLLRDPDWSFLGGCDVWALDANALTSRPGPRLVDGIEVMARIFNASLFAPIDATQALVVRNDRQLPRSFTARVSPMT
jgi:iron complex transport system substrate-binding protein